MNHHHHSTIYWKTSLFAKYNAENISDNKKKNSRLALDFQFIFSLLYLTCQMITISSWIIVHYLLFYGGCEWNRGISTS